MKKSEIAWQRFIKSGSITDYLDYKELQIEERKHKDDADDYGRNSDKRK